ncbi:unnamed protein product [Ilex paraguariensis]|uniref:Vesicle transport protein n=1 Tax=Ilex paraguariensis TaxID=185542 RepID=A0ABC8RJB5_9AQUA
MQKWFSLSSADNDLPPQQQQQTSSSLLADWNSYSASKASDESTSGTLVAGFDLEAAVRSANDTVTGTFNVVSKGVRDMPGNLQSATSSIPSGKSLMYFGLFLASGVFFVFIAFALFLPVIVLVPQKFAICFTLGCAFIIGSFFALRGPKNQFTHMSSKEVSNWYCSYAFLVLFGVFSHPFFPSFISETSLYIGIHWQHDGYHLCFDVSS